MMTSSRKNYPFVMNSKMKLPWTKYAVPHTCMGRFGRCILPDEFSVKSLITRWRFSVSSICVIWGFPLYFTSVKKITESSIIFLRNGVLILNWKENKEAGAICFEIRIPSKKNKYLLRKVPSKIYGSYFIMEKNKNIFWFVNNSEYHHREMGLVSSPISYI
jgi:hypothetical protein